MSLREDFSDWPFSGPPAPSIRRRIEDTIEALIAQLDALDDDPDLEEAGDERDQCTLEWCASRRCFDYDRLDLVHEDAEEDDEGEDNGDVEHAALERHGMGFTFSGPDDAEDGHDAEAVNEDGGDILDEPHDAVDEDAGGQECSEDFLPTLQATPKDKQLANRFAMRALALAERGKPITDPTNLPRHYSLRLVGNCMEPRVKDGQRLIFDTEAPAEPGATVVIWFKPAFVPAGFPRVIVKRLVSRDTEAITVEMLNPPRRWRLDRNTIWAVHRHTRFM